MHLFAGAGGGILADILLGHVPVCAVEIDHYCRQVLDQRQADGCLPWFPIFDDVRTFDGRPWRGLVDVVAGGFPCQDISAAGKGAGIDGERSGLWREMARIIGEVRPKYAFVENSPMLTSRGLDRVVGDLAEMGYDCRWGVVSAADAIWLAGDPAVDHLRKRIWIVAALSNPVCGGGDPGTKRPGRTARPNAARIRAASAMALRSGNADRPRLAQRESEPGDYGTQQQAAQRASWWQSEPDVGRVAHGMANRVDRLKAIGNGQVSAVAALAWRILAGDV